MQLTNEIPWFISLICLFSRYKWMRNRSWYLRITPRVRQLWWPLLLQHTMQSWLPGHNGWIWTQTHLPRLVSLHEIITYHCTCTLACTLCMHPLHILLPKSSHAQVFFCFCFCFCFFAGKGSQVSFSSIQEKWLLLPHLALIATFGLRGLSKNWIFVSAWHHLC